MSEIPRLCCSFCNYTTNKRFNLTRHEINKHSKEILQNISTQKSTKNSENVVSNVQNVVPKIQNVVPNEQNVVPNEQNVVPNKLICKKCNKIYKTERHLLNHEKKCKGVDELTCPKCMISFSDRKSKSKHIKRNNCKARSIIHARVPNAQNILNGNYNSNCNNTNSNNITNNNTIQYIINNYGNERIDYINKDDIIKYLISGNNTIPLYIKDKHFNKEFPENNNIKYTNECKCLLKEDDEWKEKDLQFLSKRLIKDNSKVLLLYCNDNKIEIESEISNEEQFEHMIDKLFIIHNKTDNEKFNNLLIQIKELIKTNSN